MFYVSVNDLGYTIVAIQISLNLSNSRLIENKNNLFLNKLFAKKSLEFGKIRIKENVTFGKGYVRKVMRA